MDLNKMKEKNITWRSRSKSYRFFSTRFSIEHWTWYYNQKFRMVVPLSSAALKDLVSSLSTTMNNTILPRDVQYVQLVHQSTKLLVITSIR